MPPPRSVTTSVSAQPTTPASDHLDFSSAEFNQIDDLDDNSGNYRAFQSLTGVVTADMRHQEQRRRAPVLALEKEREIDQPDNPQTAPPAISPSLPPALTIDCQGRLLIIDGHLERALTCAERLSQGGIDCTLCNPIHDHGGLSVTNIDSFAFVETDSIAVSGTFGNFMPTLRTADRTTSNLSTVTGRLSTLTGQATTTFDLVLDLQATPSFVGMQLPVGYYAPGEDPLLLEAALAELAQMRGRFAKPQFVVMAVDRCLHGRSPHASCRQCLDICPVTALTAEQGMVVVDQYRCQGCGACALVCPAGAIELPGPRRQLLADLAALLRQSFGDGQGRTAPIRVIFHDLWLGEPPAARVDSGVHELFFGVEELGLVGPDVLLATLAYGAASVALAGDARRPAPLKEALVQQMRLGTAIVKGAQLPAECLFYTEGCDTLPDIAAVPWATNAEPASFSLDQNRRTLLRLAAESLLVQNGVGQRSIDLSAPAPFGTIAVAPSCSLCMACVSACPAGALVADGKTPRLVQIEARCHQCGICRGVCPEECLSLMPRFLYDSSAAEALRVVHEAEPFTCVVCGQAFASATMVSRMQAKLAAHWMYRSDQQQRRLQMCRTCRTRDVFNTGDYQT